MEKIMFDAGVKCYRINGGAVLKFNPADPNLYARFLEAVEKIRDLETRLSQPDGDEPLEKMCQADRQIKKILGWVFGGDNDFDVLLGGVNVLAMAGNGQRVIGNLLQALMPVLTEGAKICAGVQVEAAVNKAKQCRQAVC